MLNWNPKCEPKKFVGGKSKRMIGRSGSPVRNHWTIDIGHGVALQSYNSIVAFRFTENFGKFKKGCVLLDCDTWNYSATTACYRRIFLEEGITETKMKIISGEYRLKSLNFVCTLGNLECPTNFYYTGIPGAPKRG